MINEDELFITALQNQDIEMLRKVAKSDLHNHFSLGGCREYIKRCISVDIAPLTHKLSSMDEMHRWVDENIGDLFGTTAKQLLAIKACFRQAKKDGVTILEIGDDVWANNYFYQGNIELLINAFQEAYKEIAPDMDFRFQIGLSRHCPIHLLEKWIEPFIERDCFSALDLYGDEMAQPIKNFKNIYRRAKKRGLILKAHVGEWGNADSVKEAVEELELVEVQHGISAANSRNILKWLADHKIQLNICPTSNVMLGRVNSLKEHPIKTLFDNGIKVTINSDDTLVFGQSVSQEYLNLYCAGVFTAQELNLIRRNGLQSRKRV